MRLNSLCADLSAPVEMKLNSLFADPSAPVEMKLTASVLISLLLLK